MFSRVVVLVVLVKMLRGSPAVLEEQTSDTSSIEDKAQSEPNMIMSPEADSSTDTYTMYFADYFIIPSDVSEKKKFGGDRSDEFLYPPDSYYKQWAEEEYLKDCLANSNNC